MFIASDSCYGLYKIPHPGGTAKDAKHCLSTNRTYFCCGYDRSADRNPDTQRHLAGRRAAALGTRPCGERRRQFAGSAGDFFLVVFTSILRTP